MVEVVFSERSAKELRSLPKNIQNRIKDKLNFFSQQKDPLAFAKSLVGDEQFGNYRYRVGDYRILFDYTKKTIFVLKVGHRRNIYL